MGAVLVEKHNIDKVESKNSTLSIKKLFRKEKEKKSETFSIHGEIKSFEYKIMAIMLTFFALTFLMMYATPYIEDILKSKTVENQVVQETEFKSMLNTVISGVSTDNDEQYVLDEDYYNEEDIKTYISIMLDVSSENITADNIKTLFWNIFIPVDSTEGVSLIKKDNKTLVLECVDKEKMNKLDYAFMGISNSDIIKASKGFYISQNNDKFVDIPYGSANVKTSGCGPISLTMALNYVNGIEIVKLEDVLKWAEENNMYEENAGTRWSLVRNFPPTVSANSKEMYISNIEQFATSIQEGEVLVTSMRKGQFTDNGHFIVITKIKDGKVSVLDSASICRSLKEWDIETVFNDSNKYFWKISK